MTANDPSTGNPTPTTDARSTAPPNVGFGVDVGGSGIKGGVVDLGSGELVGERIKILTPRPATPEAVAAAVAEIVDGAGWDGPVGITLPCVITGGIARTAANIDPSWIGTDTRTLFSGALNGRAVSVLNDADAAGIAESRFGAAKGNTGLVVLLTFGTGIGSAILYNGVLVPNSELGHMEVDGAEAEHRAASSTKEKHDWSYKRWAREVSCVLERFEALMWPDLFVAGGGISRKAEKWIPLLTNRTPVVPAELRNTAGIVGAAYAAKTGVTP